MAAINFVYDARGNETERTYLGVDGKPTLYKDGYAGYRQAYDERGNLIELSSFGIDGNRRAFLVGREEASVPCGPLEGTGGIVLHRQQVHRGLRAIAPAGEIDIPRGIRRHIIHNIEAHAGAIVTDGPGPGFIETILDDEIAHG